MDANKRLRHLRPFSVELKMSWNVLISIFQRNGNIYRHNRALSKEVHLTESQSTWEYTPGNMQTYPPSLQPISGQDSRLIKV
jgi:hypothetical protein